MRFILLIFIVLIAFSGKSQEFSTSSEKAISLFQEAMLAMDTRDFNKAIGKLKDAVKKDEKFVEAWLLMADAYQYNEDYQKVVESCRKAVEAGGDKYPVSYFFLSEALFRLGHYEESLDSAKIFLDKKVYTPYQKDKTERLIESCKFAIHAVAHPVKFEPHELGKMVNSEYDEYWPSLSADDEILMFNRLLPINSKNPKKFHNRQEDIFISEKISSTWSKALPIGVPINTPDNEGAPFITVDGMKMYFTGCNRVDGKGQCDIYVCERLDSGWSTARNLGYPINTSFSEKQASLSSDGKTLYFSSNRKGTKGDLDIWYSQLDENGSWSNPVNLGDSINTNESEQSPYIHPDNQTLYFSSNGRIGMGDFDLYLSRKNDKGQWRKAENLGYPINTNADEIGLIVDAKATKAYFSSSRNPENGRDLFSFDIPQEIKPNPVSYMKGRIFDAETHKPLRAHFDLIDLKTEKTVTSAYSNSFTGSFLLCLPVMHEYALNVSKKGYLFYSDHIMLDEEYDINQPMLKDIALQVIKPGKNVILKNIFFETNSYELRKESEVELKRLFSFLQLNSDTKIEISGHTDNVGEETDNQLLSENRAKVVVEYLISKGIEQSRLIFKGYGELVPIADNKTAEGRALNRRTEFKILQ